MFYGRLPSKPEYGRRSSMGKSSFAVEDMQNVQIKIGKIAKVVEVWDPPMGPFPYPTIAALRDRDFKIMNRYKGFCSPICDRCTLYTYGPCDLTGDKLGPIRKTDVSFNPTNIKQKIRVKK